MPTEPSLVKRAHGLVGNRLRSGDTAIDATVGNGHDTLFLAQTVGIEGKVYGFDIQQQALDNCYQQLQAHQAVRQVSLFHAGHETLPQVIPASLQAGGIQALMFNLGYLPGSDKQRITRAPTTLAALDAALPMLRHDGIITVLAYTGHGGGREEMEAVRLWMQQLPANNYQHWIETSHNDRHAPPVLFSMIKADR